MSIQLFFMLYKLTIIRHGKQETNESKSYKIWVLNQDPYFVGLNHIISICDLLPYISFALVSVRNT